MRTGKTTVSVNLRKEPRPNARVLDALEPNYPLRVIAYSPAKHWLHVIVPPLGKRDEAQDGYIDARYVKLDPEPRQPWLRPAEWSVLTVSLVIVIAATAAFLFLR